MASRVVEMVCLSYTDTSIMELYCVRKVPEACLLFVFIREFLAYRHVVSTDQHQSIGVFILAIHM